ncbi:MAG: cation:proton antiporter [Gemmobacter sp.]
MVMLEILIAGLLVLGGLFGLTGSYGLLKLRDPVQRLHAPTKATTVGIGTALFASAFGMIPAGGGFSWHEVLVAMFLLVTAPVTALFLGKLNLHRHVDRKVLPDTGTGRDWATFDEALERAGEG